MSFQSLYARAAGFEPATADGSPHRPSGPVLDRWALSEAHRLAGQVDDALDDFDTQRAGRLLSAYVDDLSNWYVRRSRRRFWDGDPAALAHPARVPAHGDAADGTVHARSSPNGCGRTCSPARPGAAESVHLASWPTEDPDLVDDQLAEQMALVRRLVELGRAARAASSVRTRQPLGRALVAASGWDDLPVGLRDEVAAELNVGELLALGDATGSLVDVHVKANFRALGKRFGKGTQPVAAAVAAADPRVLVDSLRADGRTAVEVEGESIEIRGEDVIVTESPREGWAVESGGGETVALDLELTPALVRAGLAREVVRHVQEARKSAGLQVSDRIALQWESASPQVAQVMAEHGATIADEVLATSLREGLDPDVLVRIDTGELGIVLGLHCN